jgi:putative N6-adenine-specific DNA methylase
VNFFAVCTPGLEVVLAVEVGALPGARELVPTTGGVEFAGDLTTLCHANLRLRTATRVLLRLGRFRARDFARLEREAARLPWQDYVSGPVTPTVKVSARKSRLYHTSGIAERLTRSLPQKDGAPPLSLVVQVQSDEFTVSLDSSGEPLYRRGYREATAKAPLRETLAAGLLLLAAWDPQTPLCDPMCGSGTLPLEAALLALGRAPGAQRSFAYQTWPCLQGQPVLRAPQPTSPPTALPLLHGSDRDAGAIVAAQGNAARAGLADVVTFQCLDVRDLGLGEPRGLILCNPPYGKRIAAAPSLYAELGRLARRSGFRLGVFSADAGLARAVGLPITSRVSLSTGGLAAELFLYDAHPNSGPGHRTEQA